RGAKGGDCNALSISISTFVCTRMKQASFEPIHYHPPVPAGGKKAIKHMCTKPFQLITSIYRKCPPGRGAKGGDFKVRI
ncbi:MAG TPA: hypothetical protein DHW15_10925, partial [Bacteroidetes bacterium]|nr:hypothetical protein [Bacteroidota bacterium]